MDVMEKWADSLTHPCIICLRDIHQRTKIHASVRVDFIIRSDDLQRDSSHVYLYAPDEYKNKQ
jgi:hypothetical protein